MQINVTAQELAAIIAALRIFQMWREHRVEVVPKDGDDADFECFIEDIETQGHTREPLSTEDIDDLCIRINT
jgi:hypothetical protein